MSAGAGAKDPTKFDPDVLVNSFRVCAEHVHDIPIAEFVDGCEEVKKIVYTLGSAFGIASSDITEKTGVMMDRRAMLRKYAESRGGVGPALKSEEKPADDRVRLTLQYLVLHEVRLGVEKITDGPETSGARSLLRLMWFLDFLATMIGELLADKQELSACAQAAYDVALAPHHPWLIRKTIGAAMYFLPSKANFWKNLAGTDDVSVIKPKMQEFITQMEKVRQELWSFYREHKLTDLP